MKPKFQFEFVPRDSGESAFLDLVDFGDIAVLVETVTCTPPKWLSSCTGERGGWVGFRGYVYCPIYTDMPLCMCIFKIHPNANTDTQISNRRTKRNRHTNTRNLWPECVSACAYRELHSRGDMHLCMYIYMYIHICIYIYIYTYMYICKNIHMYIYTHTYMHICMIWI